jgi:CRP-like cAMP-binding protein
MLFEGMPPLADASVQISGAMSVIPAATVQEALSSDPRIQAALSEFLFILSAQCLQTVACNRLHTLEQRCCRWLLMLLERSGDPDLPLTQDMLATMLGSGRPRINALLAALERDRLLQRFRGRVRLLSRRGLEARACECYRPLLQQTDEGRHLSHPANVT